MIPLLTSASGVGVRELLVLAVENRVTQGRPTLAQTALDVVGVAGRPIKATWRDAVTVEVQTVAKVTPFGSM